MTSTTDYARLAKQRAQIKMVKKVVTYTLLAIWALVVLFPFYWMILSSVKSYASYNSESIPQFFTPSPTLENYITAFTSVSLVDYFVNTIIFTVATTALMLVIIVPAAFAFARLNFRGKDILFVLFLSSLFLPLPSPLQDDKRLQ